MKKKKWIIIISSILLIIILGIFIFSKSLASDNSQKENQDNEKSDNKVDKGEIPKAFTKAMLKRADDAFSNGISFDDPENDWYLPEPGTMQWDKPDNPAPYPLPFTDLKSVSLGADEEYLYVKLVYYGEFPKKMPSYDGDDIFSTGGGIEGFRFITKEGKPDYAEIGSGVMYIQFTGDNETNGYVPLDKPTVGQLAMIFLIGQDEHGESLYKTMNGAGFIEGGPGYDYLLSAFPLSEFGVSYGQEVNLTLGIEAGSNKWHHESIDLILNENNSKSGSMIVWKLGTNEYKVFPPEF